jgi:Tfp pilus assembly PilM family ATPase
MFSFSQVKESTACMIDDRFIRFFSVEKNGKKVSLKNFFSERIPDDLFSTESFVSNAAFITRLNEIRKKTGIQKIHLVIPDQYVTVFHTVVPMDLFVPGKKDFQKVIEQYLDNLLKSHEEFSNLDVIADYDLIDETVEGYHLHVAVARPEQFKHIPALFESGGFTIEHIDISSFAIHRLAKTMYAQKTYGVISLGTHTAKVSVIRSGNIITSTVVPVGSEHLFESLQNTLSISRSEAENIIHKYGILHSHPDKNVLGQLFQTLKPLVVGVEYVQSIASSQDLYNHDFYKQQVDEFYLYGIGASISGVAQYLGIKTNTIIRPIDLIPLDFIDEEILLQVPVELLSLYLPVMSTAVHYLND